MVMFLAGLKWFRARALATVGLLTLMLMVATTADARTGTTRGTVLVMGDSLSAAYGMRAEQGWVALAAKEAPQWRFVNASVSGETTAGGRSRFDAELARARPDIVVLELGANDGLRGLPLKQMGENLGWMIGRARAHGARVLLIGMRMPPNYGSYAVEFGNSFIAISDALKVPRIDFFLAPLGTDRSLFQPDNMHPTPAAQPVLARTVLDALGAMAPGRH